MVRVRCSNMAFMSLSPEQLAARIDHTNLKPEATAVAIDRLVDEARRYRFASVCVNGVYLRRVRDGLGEAEVDACAVAGFPLGAMRTTHKAIEASGLVKEGAGEIDFVAHLPNLLAKDFEAARAEWLEVVRACRAAKPRVVVKVIVESACLIRDVSPDEAEARLALACRAARESGCDFIKTSTGFHPAGGASVEAVAWMRKHAEGLKVKASGGIRTLVDARAMLEAGADRLGCSAGVTIVDELSQSRTGP